MAARIAREKIWTPGDRRLSHSIDFEFDFEIDRIREPTIRLNEYLPFVTIPPGKCEIVSRFPGGSFHRGVRKLITNSDRCTGSLLVVISNPFCWKWHRLSTERGSQDGGQDQHRSQLLFSCRNKHFTASFGKKTTARSTRKSLHFGWA